MSDMQKAVDAAKALGATSVNEAEAKAATLESQARDAAAAYIAREKAAAPSVVKHNWNLMPYAVAVAVVALLVAWVVL